MIADKVFNLGSFKRQYKALQALSVSESIPNLIWNESKESLIKKINWNNILGIASILSHSGNSEYLDAALRISQTCLISETSEVQKGGAIVILESLTNIPALKLAIERKLIKEDYGKNLPLPFKLQANKIKIENSIVVDEKVISLNRFQKKVYDAFLDNNSLSISAPTSAGKSFILYQLLLEELKLKNRNIVYIVPTRALISQVEEDLREILIDNKLNNVNLTTVPNVENVENDKTNLFVFTQERLHWLQVQPNVKDIDLLIVDEAHKIDNGNRGILLQRKIEDVVDQNPNVRIFFSSPFTSNPEILLEGLNTNNTQQTINTEFIAVNQNLLYVTQVKRKPKEWKIDLVLKNETIPIGKVELKDRPTTEAKKIALISNAISNTRGGSLIYANGAAEAEKYAKIIQTLSSKNDSKKIKDLTKLVENVIHKDYTLAKVLGNNVAFHYGNMPLLIRQEIEKLFKENEIKYLVCTSTLLEGVNLPATAVFVRKPTRGRGKPLNENDFWNLAGRAGRWGKEFSGNIICIEPNEWEIKPSPDKKKQKIKKALDIIEVTRSEEFLNFIKEGSPRRIAESNQDLEFAFGYYYSRYIQNKLTDDSQLKHELIQEFDKLKENIIIPNEILLKNPGISPIAQQELYDYFKENVGRIEDMIPVYPEDSNSFDEYTKLVGRIGKTLAEFPPQLNKSRAILLINWMKGRPLSYLISSSLKNYRDKGNTIKLDKVIRDTMNDVENFARFRFAKESSCYIDILRFFIKEIGRVELLEDIPDLNLWLEFGVSQATQLSLLSLGLSRNTVIAISELTTNTSMTKEDVIKWLSEIDVNELDLSPIMVDEILKVV